MLYDSLLIFSVLFFASAVAIVFNRGEAIESNVFFTLYLLFTWFTYYAFSWRRSGQTLGMRAWKIRIVTEDGGNPGWGSDTCGVCSNPTPGTTVSVILESFTCPQRNRGRALRPLRCESLRSNI